MMNYLGFQIAIDITAELIIELFYEYRITAPSKFVKLFAVTAIFRQSFDISVLYHRSQGKKNF